MHTSSEYRTYARNALRGKWGISVLVSFVASLFAGGGSGLSFNPFEFFNKQSNSEALYSTQEIKTIEDLKRFLEEYSDKIKEFIENPVIFTVTAGVIGLSLIISLAFFIINCGIDLGHKSYYISLTRGEYSSIGQLFSRMRIIVKAVLLNLYTSILVFLWSLLFIIPGIIAAYRYSMSGWIMAQNPDIGVISAVNESKRLMHGNKLNLFFLQFSFIGWAILCMFTCGVGYFWLSPYMNAATGAFYLDISGQLQQNGGYGQTTYTQV